MSYIKVPENIEDRSFEIIQEIIDADYPSYRFTDDLQEKAIKRCVHTTADFDWLEILKFSKDVNEKLISALQKGATIFTDTNMALSGMNKTRLAELGCKYFCYVADPKVAAVAKERGITRSMAAVEVAAEMAGEKIFVFGNAPTALFRLLELYAEGKLAPSVVIGVPVGFVGAVESKDALMGSNLPYIAAKGRKGGSNVAAAIMNAYLYNMPKA